jgi:hypothetical protein
MAEGNKFGPGLAQRVDQNKKSKGKIFVYVSGKAAHIHKNILPPIGGESGQDGRHVNPQQAGLDRVM